MDVATLLQEAQSVDEATLKSWIGQLDEAYRIGEPLINDDDFDYLIDLYNKRFGPYTVNIALPKENKLKLPFFLPSLDKIKMGYKEEIGGPATLALANFESSYPGPYLLEDKIDGITALIYQGKMYTKGRSHLEGEGSDISEYLTLMRLPPAGDYAIRGEIVMTKDMFELYKQEHPEAKNARNTTAGLIMRGTINVSEARKLKFFAYQIVNREGMSPEEQISTLHSLGFDLPWVGKVEHLEIANLQRWLEIRKGEAPYGVDGIVILQNKPHPNPKEGNPKEVIAFKTTTNWFDSRVITVEWFPSKDRILYPVVHYEDHEFEGSLLANANGKNAKNIIEHGIGTNAIIRVTKGGDSIPEILEVLTPADPTLPDLPPEDYSWDRNQVHFVLKYDNKWVLAKRIEYFINKMGIQNIGPGRIMELVEKGYDNVYKVLSAQIKDFMSLPRVGDKTAIKMYESIQTGIKDVPLYRVMAASGIFGRGFSEKRAILLLTKYPNIMERTELPYEQLVELLLSIEGFGPVLSIQVAFALPRFKEWLNKHNMITITTKIPSTPPSVEEGKLNGKLVIVSGFRGDFHFKEAVEREGGVYSETNPTKKEAERTILVQGREKPGKRKEELAVLYGIKIMSRREFEEKYLQ